MVEINKKIDENGYDNFKIITDDGSFDIKFGETLDLYWSYWPKENIKNWPISKTFTITKENYFLYQKLDELYTKIKEKRPYSKIVPEEDNSFLEEFNLEDINNLDKKDYAFEKLFQNGVIKWYSDDAPLEDASKVEIKKAEEFYDITFYQGKEDSGFPTYTVRFRNSGSRYEPYNIAFMNMYIGLSEYNQDYHQIHIEEYLYQQKTYQKTKKGA